MTNKLFLVTPKERTYLQKDYFYLCAALGSCQMLNYRTNSKNGVHFGSMDMFPSSFLNLLIETPTQTLS